jgi:hypothetical protein
MNNLSRRALLLGGATAVLAGGVFKYLGGSASSMKAFLASPKIAEMPIKQVTGVLIDWKARSKLAYDLLFDYTAKGPHLPVVWLDTERRNYNFDMFALPAYLADYRQNPDRAGSHEALSGLGAVLGASLAGINMRDYEGRNFVKECLGYHQQNRVAKIVFNQTADSGSESSFWYMIYPNIAFFAINSFYPDEPLFDSVSKDIANEFVQMLDHLKSIEGEFTFEFAGYNFLNKEGVFGGHREPDAAAGVAWVLYMAYLRFGDKEYLDGAQLCLQYLDDRPVEQNPFYESLLAFGVTIAARMNKTEGTSHDVAKFFDWIFDGFSDSRAGWGIISDVWGLTEVHGLQGSVTDSGGYAFAFNTFNTVAAIAPLPIYAPEYASQIGKWLYNVALSARLFYPDQVPPENQSQPELRETYGGAFAYEGIRKEWAFVVPYATADSRRNTWAETDLGIYGSSLVGVMAGLIHHVEDSGVVVFEISKTDFFAESKEPVYLAYNPNDSATKYLDREILSGESILIATT